MIWHCNHLILKGIPAFSSQCVIRSNKIHLYFQQNKYCYDGWIISKLGKLFEIIANQQIKEEVKKEIKICIETNENENTTQNLWDSVKAVLRGRFMAIQAYLRKQGKNQINNLTIHLKQLEKEEMENPRVSSRSCLNLANTLIILW